MSPDTMTLPALITEPAREVAPKSLEAVNADLRKQVADLLHQGQVAAVRLQLAQAYTAMMMVAQSAALNYGINYADLPEYKDPEGLLRAAHEAPLLDGQEAFFEYIRRVEHALAAAIRRKQMRVV